MYPSMIDEATFALSEIITPYTDDPMIMTTAQKSCPLGRIFFTLFSPSTLRDFSKDV
jgi:hypothetical protein